MHFGEFSPEEWSKVLHTSNRGLSPNSYPSKVDREPNNVNAKDSALQSSLKNSAQLTLEDEAPKFSTHSYYTRMKHDSTAKVALQRLSNILHSAEDDSSLLQEKTLFEAAISQGIDEQSCTYYCPRGIINRGNTCYISAVLQALLALNNFRLLFIYLLDTIRQAAKEHIIVWDDFARRFPLVQKLCHLIEQCMLEANNSKWPRDSKNDTTRVVTQWSNRKESVQAVVSRISKNPMSIEEWFQWKPNDSLISQSLGLSRDSDVRGEDSRQQVASRIDSNFGGRRLNSFLSLIYGGNQEDSQEFLIHMLNELHEELLLLRKYLDEVVLSSTVEIDVDFDRSNAEVSSHLKKMSISGESSQNDRNDDEEDGVWEQVGKKGKSAIVRPFQFQLSWISFIFGGILRSELHRVGSKSSVSREPFLFLELDIENSHVHSVYDALRLYMEPESLDGVVSETTKQRVHARKQLTIEKLPRVLIMQLKRFTIRNGDQFYRKLAKHVDFSVDICLPSMLLAFSHTYTKPQNRSYSLAAVVTHLGREMVGGHYICDIRWRVPPRDGSSSESVWLNCDDSCMSCISEKDVLGRQAYLLFYMKNDES